MSKTTHKCLRKKYTVTLFHLLWKKKMKAFVNMDEEHRGNHLIILVFFHENIKTCICITAFSFTCFNFS